MASKYSTDEVADPLAAGKDAREYLTSFSPPPASLPQIGLPGQVVPPTAHVQPNIQETSTASCPEPKGDATSQDAGFKTEHETEQPVSEKASSSNPINEAADASEVTRTKEDLERADLPQISPSSSQMGQAVQAPAQTRQNTQEASTCTEPEEDVCLKTVKHVAQLPVVQETLTSVGNVYTKVKKWNCVTRLYFATAERTLNKLMVTPPVSSCLRTPMRIADNIFLKSLLYMERKFPILTLPSQQILETTKNSVNEKLEPCKIRITAVKNYGAKKIRNGIEGALNSLPESLVPENVQCTRPTVAAQEDVAVEPHSHKFSLISEYIGRVKDFFLQEPQQPNEADTRDVTSEENTDQQSTGAVNKTSSLVTAESSESCDQPQDTELKDLQNTESTRKGDLGKSDCQADEIAKMVSQGTKIPEEAEESNLKAPSEITSDTVEPTSVKPLTKTIEEFLGFERAHDDAGTSDLQKPPMA